MLPPHCQSLWGSVLLPSGYSGEDAGKVGHLFRGAFLVALKSHSSQARVRFNTNSASPAPKIDNTLINVYKNSVDKTNKQINQN